MTPLARVVRLFRRPKTLGAREAYALWAESYPPQPHNALMRIEQSVMAPLVALSRPVCALDVGTGTGRYVSVLAAAGARRVVGIDLSAAMLARHAGGALVRGDACRLPFRDASFDVVTASLMVGDIERLGDWVAEIARVLAPGGHAIYSDFHPAWATARWRRTFATPDGRSFQIGYHPHDIADHLSCLEAHALDVRTVREPRLRRAGPAVPARRDPPVVVVFDAVKQGHRGFAPLR